MERFPNEILERIFQKIQNPLDIIPLCRVCKRWNLVLQRDRGLFKPLSKQKCFLSQIDHSERKLAQGLGPWFNACLKLQLAIDCLSGGIIISENDFETAKVNHVPQDEVIHTVSQYPLERNELTRRGIVYHEVKEIGDDTFHGVGILDINSGIYSFTPCSRQDLLSGGVDDNSFYFDSVIPGLSGNVYEHNRWSFPRNLLGTHFELLESNFLYFTIKCEDDYGRITSVARVQSSQATSSYYPNFVWKTNIDNRTMILVSVHCFVTIFDDEICIYSIPWCQLLKRRKLQSEHRSGIPMMYQAHDFSVCENHLLWFDYNQNTLYSCPFQSILQTPNDQILEWSCVVDIQSQGIKWGKFSHYWSKRFVYITGAKPGGSYLCLIDIWQSTCRVYQVTAEDVEAKFPYMNLADPASSNGSFRGGFWHITEKGNVVHITGNTLNALYERYVMSRRAEPVRINDNSDRNDESSCNLSVFFD